MRGTPLKHRLNEKQQKAQKAKRNVPESQESLIKLCFFRGEKPNKHKQLFGIVPGTGWGSNLFMCCLLGEKGETHLLGEKGKHMNEIPSKSRENAGTVPAHSRDNIPDNPLNILFMRFLVYGPRGPGNRINSFSLERMKKTHSPTHEMFILD